MFRYRIILIFIFYTSVLLGQNHRVTPEEYIQQNAQMAIDEMNRTGIPASITLAQGILESDCGNSALASMSNNHFGIKCHDDWTGEKVYYDDDRDNECFRKYEKPEDSFRDHSDFLRNKPRYSTLFELEITDYKAWAKGLKKAGYATDNMYADRLIDIIEKYNLDQFDKGAKPIAYQDPSRNKHQKFKGAEPDGISVNPFKTDVLENNRIQYVIVKEGDTFASLTQKYDLMPWQLPKYNEIPEDSQLIPGQIIYLQPKRWRADAFHKIHLVKEGETMHQISQIYGIKLKKLYRKNRMDIGSEPKAGQKLWLRKRKPKGETV